MLYLPITVAIQFVVVLCYMVLLLPVGGVVVGHTHEHAEDQAGGVREAGPLGSHGEINSVWDANPLYSDPVHSRNFKFS